jgi:hypothetical protein
MVMVKCQVNRKDHYLDCLLCLLPGDPDELCILHSRLENKNLNEFEKERMAKLNRGDYDFRMVFFPTDISFERQVFNGVADFVKAKFVGNANFYRAIFNSDVNFFWVEFAGSTNFRGAKFTGDRIIFRSINFSKKEHDFRRIELDPKTIIEFRDLSLAYVEFSGTDLRHPEFRNVTWNSYRGRQVVYDELKRKERMVKEKLSLRESYAHVEEIYRYLKVNYEKAGDYKQAGDFHYGEMEMHRKASRWRRWFPLSWYNLYWILSGYGERPLRSIVVLILLWLGMAGLIFGLGFKAVNIEHTLTIWDAIVFVAQVATFQIRWDYQAISLGGIFCTTLIRIILPIQVALFILAIRHRLGRRR